MGTALRKLKKRKKSLWGKGRLTERMIDKMQNYYGIAIRSNIGNIDKMKKAILAVLFHCASSKEKQYHNFNMKATTSHILTDKKRQSHLMLLYFISIH